MQEIFPSYNVSLAPALCSWLSPPHYAFGVCAHLPINMRATAVFATALFAGAALAAPASTNETAADEFARSKEQGDAIIASAKQKALDSLEARAKQLRHRGETPNCTTDNLTFRKE